MSIAIGTAFVAGALSFFSPCILPMLTVYFTMITGLSMEQLTNMGQDRSMRRSIVINTALFALGFGLVFTAAGAAAGQVGSLLPKLIPILSAIGGIFVIGFGLYLVGLNRLPVIRRILTWQRHYEHGELSMGNRGFTAFATGLVFAVACSHCIAPTLYSILIFAGSTGSAQSGAIMMAAFSVGLAIPYLIVAFGFGEATGALRRLRPYSRHISAVSGILMVLFGVLLLSGKFALLTQWFSGWLPYRLPFGM